MDACICIGMYVHVNVYARESESEGFEQEKANDKNTGMKLV